MQNKYLNKAQRFIELARKEFNEARSVMDEERIQQAAEKGWGAVREATKALFESMGLKVPRGTTRMEDEFHALENRYSKIREMKIRLSFMTFLYDLHVECFGDGTVRVKKIDRDLRDVKEYISIIENLIKR